MRTIKIFSIIQFLLIILNGVHCKPDKYGRELIFVYEHARHGARGPSSSYNSIFENGIDEYGVEWEYDGELSAIGKIQHYFLGIRNRLKYDGFIDFKHYNPMEILIHATDFNRTHQSITSELYAMFKDSKEKELVGNETKFTLINQHYLKEKDSQLLDKIEKEIEEMDGKVNSISFPIFNIHEFPKKRIFLVDDCHKLDQYRDEKVGQKVENFYAEFQRDYARYLRQLPLIKEEYFRIYNKMKSITDHFICDYDGKKNLTMVESLGLNLTSFYNFSRRFYGSFIFDWFIDEYTAGLEETHLMQDLLGYMDLRIKHYPNTTYRAPKMVMDCGHDTTVGPIARFMDSAFGCGYHEFCDFACNVYFELYRKVENGIPKYSVDYYLDDELMFENKDYNEFKAKMEAKFWKDDFTAEFCGEKEEVFEQKKKAIERHSSFLLGATLISSSLFLIFVTSTFIFYRRFKKLEKRIKENPMLDKEIEGSEMPVLS